MYIKWPNNKRCPQDRWSMFHEWGVAAQKVSRGDEGVSFCHIVVS